MKMTYNEMIRGLKVYIKDAVFNRLNVNDAMDQCLRRYVDWQGERGIVWAMCDLSIWDPLDD